jgi:hypothetical protein
MSEVVLINILGYLLTDVKVYKDYFIRGIRFSWDCPSYFPLSLSKNLGLVKLELTRPVYTGASTVGH